VENESKVDRFSDLIDNKRQQILLKAMVGRRAIKTDSEVNNPRESLSETTDKY